jgi:hypothetical protein
VGRSAHRRWQKRLRGRVVGGVAEVRCRGEVGFFGYAQGTRSAKEEGPGLIGVRAPGPPVRSAFAGDLQPLYACLGGCCPALGEGRWGPWASRRTGSTTASVVGYRYAFATAVTTATSTAAQSARGFAGVSRCGAPKRVTSAAVAGQAGTQRVNVPGARAECKQ